VIAVGVPAATLFGAQSTPAAPPAPPTLSVVTTFADGHTHYELLSSRPAGYGTGDFPRIYGADSPTLLRRRRRCRSRRSLSQLQAIPDRDASLLPEAQLKRSQAKRMVVEDVRRFQTLIERSPGSHSS